MRTAPTGGTHMKERGRPFRLSVAAAAVALVAAACGGDNGGSDAAGASELSGEIAISGSSTVEPISTLVAQKFASENPGVAISVDGPGTGDGFELFCKGDTDVSDASRPIEAEEAAACEKAGIEYVELKVGIDDITAPGEESGTYDSFAELVLEDIAYEERGIKEDDPVVRPDYQASANDNVILQGIEGSGSSLGWVGFAFFAQAGDTVKGIEIDGGDGCVAP